MPQGADILGGIDSEADPANPGPLRMWGEYFKPAHLFDLSGPIFKTQKQLAGRALVSDSFSRAEVYGGDAMSDVIEVPGNVGFAYYAHKDGYNVLYGDWSAKWYGDPQQRIMYYPREAGRTFTWGFVHTMQYNNIYYGIEGSSTLWEGGATWDAVYRGPTFNTWHMFDVNNGIDVE